MKFSVLTTVYKKETPRNLRKSLLSSYQQTLKPTERDSNFKGFSFT